MMNRIFITVFALSVFNSYGAAGSKPSEQMIHRFLNPSDKAELKYTSEPFKTLLWKIDWYFYPTAGDRSNCYILSLRDNRLYICGEILLEKVSEIVAPKSSAKTELEARQKMRFLVLQHLVKSHGDIAAEKYRKVFLAEVQDMPDVCAVADCYKEAENATLIIDLRAADQLCREHDQYRTCQGPAPKPYSNSTSFYRQRS